MYHDYNFIARYVGKKIQHLIDSGQTHYKCIHHKTGFQTRFPGSKSRDNAPHADCCKVTIELPAHAAATIRVFLTPGTVPSRKLYLNYL